jgi:hypothetical protein
MRSVLLLACLLVACDRPPPTRTSPDSAFSRIKYCVDGRGARCLFDELDRDSRWSAASIQRLLAEMRELVTRSYPADRQGAAFGAWTAEAEAADTKELFEIFCDERHCMQRVARGFGAVVKVIDQGPSSATVETARGGSFPMACVEGEWGLSIYREELQQAKIHLGDTLEQVRRNAEAYDEQRIVSGDGGNAK